MILSNQLGNGQNATSLCLHPLTINHEHEILAGKSEIILMEPASVEHPTVIAECHTMIWEIAAILALLS